MKIQYPSKSRKKRTKKNLQKHPYETVLKKCEVYMKQIKDPIIVEIGAFAGSTIHRLCKHLNLYKAYCIEGCPVNFKLLKKATKNYKHIKIFNVAIASYDGISNFYSGYSSTQRGSSSCSSLYANAIIRADITSVVCHKIPCFTLDNFCRLNHIYKIDCLKINCEGCEFDIFDSPTHDFLDMTRILCIQIHGHCQQFNSDNFINKKKSIIEQITNKQFKFDCGDKDIYKKPHINKMHSNVQMHIDQMWVKERCLI